MKAYNENYNKVLENLNSNENGLTEKQVALSKQKYGSNEMTKPKAKTLLKRIIEALFEPMLIILEIAVVITLGVNIGKAIKGGETDFYECFGIIFAILISVILTVVMEGKSQKAFQALSKIYNTTLVKVKRNGEIKMLAQKDIVVGDIVYLESGDKVVADGRLIASATLEIDESMLTGESKTVKKFSGVVLEEKTALAERKNMVYSGTFVTSGSGVMVVTAVGDNAEMGVIASELHVKNVVSAPLQEKLDRLGKFVASLGLISATLRFMCSITKLFVTNNVSFDTIEDAFLSSIILIVASVPEGLPTTVAIALTLNVVKLYKSNALIKKLVAAETVGCVSVICSDKTGTLTENKMRVVGLHTFDGYKFLPMNKNHNMIINFAINTTAERINQIGQPTELALIDYLAEEKIADYKELRKKYKVTNRLPFNSENKYMRTTALVNGKEITYYKGAPEIIVNSSKMTNEERKLILKSIEKAQREGGRVLAFASSDRVELKNLHFDGYVVIADQVRKDVYSSVLECKKAKIKVKMLTGDNIVTAFSIAKQLKIANSMDEVVNASDLEGLSDNQLKDQLKKITVIARSTPKSKLKIVTLLKEMGEVVAVTGDGVNDAPAIKHADIGIAMGAGSEVTKEASDIVLLDNSFSTIVKAISFGRNIYQNFQRFIMFQLSVNATAVMFIIISLVLGLENPFNTIMLLWINLIMDGPPALTLGLEMRGNELMENSPTKRSNNIVNRRMLAKIAVNSFIMCSVLIVQSYYNFIGCARGEMKTVLFNLFILFQLFNAFNCREFGSKSVFSGVKNNKLMLIVFLVTFVLQILLSEIACGIFKTTPLSPLIWLNIIITASFIVLLSEIYKLIYRSFLLKRKLSLKIKKTFN